MNELAKITSVIKSSKFKSLPRQEQREMKERQQVLIKSMVKRLLKEHLEPFLADYELDSDIRIYNDGDDGIKIDFVEYWSDVDSDDVSVTAKSKDVKEPVIQFEDNEKAPFLAHKLDWSPFEYGFTIDSKYHQNIFKALGHTLEKGQAEECIVKIDGNDYPCHFDCPNIAGSKRVRLLYNGKKKHLGMYLQKLFPQTYEYIKNEKEMFGGRHQVKIPESMKAMLYLEETAEPLIFRMTYKKN